VDGTGTNAIIPGIQRGGKTGTASNPVSGKDALLSGAITRVSWIAPANAPCFP